MEGKSSPLLDLAGFVSVPRSEFKSQVSYLAALPNSLAVDSLKLLANCLCNWSGIFPLSIKYINPQHSYSQHNTD
jgi:hypothetical protein